MHALASQWAAGSTRTPTGSAASAGAPPLSLLFQMHSFAAAPSLLSQMHSFPQVVVPVALAADALWPGSERCQ